MPWGPFAMIICYLSLATRVPISCVTSRRGGAVKNRADLYGLIMVSRQVSYATMLIHVVIKTIHIFRDTDFWLKASSIIGKGEHPHWQGCEKRPLFCFQREMEEPSWSTSRFFPGNGRTALVSRFLVENSNDFKWPEGCFLKKYFWENLAAVLRRTTNFPGYLWENCGAVLMRTIVEIS